MKACPHTIVLMLILIAGGCSKEPTPIDPGSVQNSGPSQPVPDTAKPMITAVNIPVTIPGTVIYITGKFSGPNFTDNIITFDGVVIPTTSGNSTILASELPNINFRDSVTVTVTKNNVTASFSFPFTKVGTVSTFAGDHTNGFKDGKGLTAQFSLPFAMTRDKDGNLYVTELVNNKGNSIRKITPDAEVSTIVPPADSGFADGTTAVARFNTLSGIAIDANGVIYVADSKNHCIRKIVNGMVSTFAGNGTAGYTDGTGIAARFNYPYGIVIDANGNLYVSDQNNHCIRKITPAGIVSTFAGGLKGFADATGSTAQFDTPTGMAIDGADNIYVWDSGNKKVRKISNAATVATYYYYSDLNGLTNLTVNKAGTIVYISTQWSIFYKILATGSITPIAGNMKTEKTISGYSDGYAATAYFYGGFGNGLSVDGAGNMFVADGGNHVIRKISP